ncbi:hypothetical protein [Corynebacterium nasicanis]|uniref:DNA-directed RNA polymerase II n=1 Tax=Corynebacterium nasicanis TaxID=1448267 RepID=A0ABW1QDU4_9CORY
MNTEARRVYIFIVVGLLAAAAIGYGVWRASTPATPSASDIATQTPEVATISEHTQLPQVTTPSPEPDTSTEAAAQTPAPPRNDDPFLAPHALVQAVPSVIAPTTVYRPENVRPSATSTSTAPMEPTETAAPTDAVEPELQTTSDTPTTAPAPTTTSPAPAPSETATPTPTPTATPSEPNGQQPQSEPDQPAEPTEPTEPEVEQAAVTQPQSAWWNPARWFPFSS